MSPFSRYLLAVLLVLPLVARAQTVIDSESLEVAGGDELNKFTFSGGVRVESEGMHLLCQELFVVTRRTGDADATVGQIGPIESILAVGGVEIHQADRVAYAGRAEVDPGVGTLILSEKPRIVDARGTVEGWKIILNRQTQTAQVLPDPSITPEGGRQRARVILQDTVIPGIEGYDFGAPGAQPAPAPAAEAPATRTPASGQEGQAR